MSSICSNFFNDTQILISEGNDEALLTYILTDSNEVSEIMWAVFVSLQVRIFKNLSVKLLGLKEEHRT
jgi:hypothetical protein